MSKATIAHPFIPGPKRPSSTGWYAICADCGGTEEARFGHYGSPERVHLSPFVRRALARELPAKEYAR